MSLNIKLVYNKEIHRLSRLPSSFNELESYCMSVFHDEKFTIKYLDEEEDEITIACDSDLFTAYATAESLGLKSLRLLLSAQNSSERPESHRNSSNFRAEPERHESQAEPEVVWPRHTCDGCGIKPIVGPRFNCTVCEDFDFCSNCEKNMNHEHPFLKFLQPTNDQYMNIDLTPENLYDSIMKVKDFIISNTPQMQVKEHLKLKNVSAGEIPLQWIVKNTGNSQWPRGCTAVLLSGNVSAVFEPVPMLQPGEEGIVAARVWSEGGMIFGKWKIVTENGLKIGKVKATAEVKSDFDEKVQMIAEMGFDIEVAREALMKAGGDVQKAVISL